MTPHQKELLLKFGHRGLCVDATHNATKYNMKLTTVMVVDDNQRGRPVAFFFCNEASEVELNPLFAHLKHQ